MHLCLSFVELIKCAAPISPVYRPIPTLKSSVDDAPSLIPNILDTTAPNAQKICPGYKASNVATTVHGYTADLTLAGKPCNAYGNDIVDLSLTVEYQNKQRLNVKIVPRYLGARNQSQYILPAHLAGLPTVDAGATLLHNDLNFTYSNTPSFQFEVSRGRDVIFSTMGSVIVFEDQFLELVTPMVSNYNAYGLAEYIGNFRLGTNATRTFYAADAGNPIDGYPQPSLTFVSSRVADLWAGTYMAHTQCISKHDTTIDRVLYRMACMREMPMVRNGFCAPKVLPTELLAVASTCTFLAGPPRKKSSHSTKAV